MFNFFTKFGTIMNKKIEVAFYQEQNGNEPVRKWLKNLEKDVRIIIGEDLKRVQYIWPIGMPLVRPLKDGLYELRSTLPNRIARIIFMLHQDKIVLLHGLIKKTEQLTDNDLNIAKRRAKNIKEEII